MKKIKLNPVLIIVIIVGAIFLVNNYKVNFLGAAVTPAECAGDAACIACVSQPPFCWTDVTTNNVYSRGYRWANGVCGGDGTITYPACTAGCSAGVCDCSCTGPCQEGKSLNCEPVNGECCTTNTYTCTDPNAAQGQYSCSGGLIDQCQADGSWVLGPRCGAGDFQGLWLCTHDNVAQNGLTNICTSGCTPNCPSPLNVTCGTYDHSPTGCGSLVCNVLGVQCITGTCSNGACISSNTCIDSDGGNTPNIKGYITLNGVQYDDICTSSSRLDEAICTDLNGDGIFNRGHAYIDCTCSNGACTQPPPPTNNTHNCTDSDGGIIPNTKGYIIFDGIQYDDSCVISSQIDEKHCQLRDGDFLIGHAYIDCTCSNGACTQPPPPPSTDCLSKCSSSGKCHYNEETKKCESACAFFQVWSSKLFKENPDDETGGCDVNWFMIGGIFVGIFLLKGMKGG